MLEPVIETAIPVSPKVPVLVKVKFCVADPVPICWLPKLKVVGVKVAVLDPPDPLKGSNVGEPGAFVGILRFPDCAPPAVGQNLTTAVQLDPAGSDWLTLQVPPAEKENTGLLNVNPPVITKGAVPELVIVSV